MMTLPISAWGLIIGLATVVALMTGAWLLLRARDVARMVNTNDNQISPGRARRRQASRATVRLVLAMNIVATLVALSLFALVATRVIGSNETRTDPYAQRP
jgi:uncharacterized iron-regulated membrane protein